MYLINKTNGDVLMELADGVINQAGSSLTLIGKNVSNYGEYINENLVHLLENFANTDIPNVPIVGQLWYDLGDRRLKVYDGTTFRSTSGTIATDIVPSSISKGDLWIDTARQQLYFNDGVATVLAGPIYTNAQGMSGFQTSTVQSTTGTSHVIVYLYVGKVLLGIFSAAAFAPAIAIPGFTGSIKVGFSPGTLAGLIFDVPTGAASKLVDGSGIEYSVEDFFLASENTTLNGTVTIQNVTPLRLGVGGSNGSVDLEISNLLFKISSMVAGQNFQISSKTTAGVAPSLHISANTRYVGIYTSSPAATLDINGTVIVRDNLTVQGETTIVGGLSIANSSINAESNSTITLNASDISVSNAKIINVGNPVLGTDAVNKNSMVSYTKARALALVGDVTGLSTAQIASDVIAVVYPPAEYTTEVTICRMRCVDAGVVTNREFKIVSNVWQYIGLIS